MREICRVTEGTVLVSAWCQSLGGYSDARGSGGPGGDRRAQGPLRALLTHDLAKHRGHTSLDQSALISLVTLRAHVLPASAR